jgi:hypothetical protein
MGGGERERLLRTALSSPPTFLMSEAPKRTFALHFFSLPNAHPLRVIDNFFQQRDSIYFVYIQTGLCKTNRIESSEAKTGGGGWVGGDVNSACNQSSLALSLSSPPPYSLSTTMGLSS